MDSIRDCYELNNGLKIPCLGYGTFKVTDGDSVQIIKNAITAGYRYFDTASLYFTEEFLGQAIKESNIPREEFFVVSKLWGDQLGYEKAKQGVSVALEKLQMEYIDIMLIHWPRPTADCENWKELGAETWRALEEAYEEGKIKGIGFSNFLPYHMEHILANCKIKPVVNQLELHPGYMQLDAVQYCKEHDIRLQAWSPLARRRISEHPLLTALADKYGVSVAQICLRFLIQLEIIPIPKTSDPGRMKENMDVFHFSISDEDMHRLLSMPQAGWSGEHPDPELAQMFSAGTRREDLLNM